MSSKRRWCPNGCSSLYARANYCGHCGATILKKCSTCGSKEPAAEGICRKEANLLLADYRKKNGSKVREWTTVTLGGLFILCALIVLIAILHFEGTPVWAQIFYAVFILIVSLVGIRKMPYHEKKLMEECIIEYPTYYVLENIKLTKNKNPIKRPA